MDIAAEVARTLLQINAIKLNPQNPFTWASGMKSPIYCDNRLLLSFPKQRDMIKKYMIEKSKDFGTITMIVGVATAGIAHGALLADALGLPFAYVRSKAKGHGRQNLIEGDIRGNERVLVVEDLISTGGSCLSAVQILEAQGCYIAGVLAIFSYGFDKAKDAFEAEECDFATLSDYNVMVEQAADMGYINAEEKELLANWRRNPESWGH